MFFISVDSDAGFASADTDIIIGDLPIVEPPVESEPDDSVCFPIKARTGNFVVICL